MSTTPPPDACTQRKGVATTVRLSNCLSIALSLEILEPSDIRTYGVAYLREVGADGLNYTRLARPSALTLDITSISIKYLVISGSGYFGEGDICTALRSLTKPTVRATSLSCSWNWRIKNVFALLRTIGVRMALVLDAYGL